MFKKETILEIAEKAGFTSVWKKQFIISPYGFEDADLSEELLKFASLLIAKEMEEIADNVETFYDPIWEDHYQAGNELATMIRSRAVVHSAAEIGKV